LGLQVLQTEFRREGSGKGVNNRCLISKQTKKKKKKKKKKKRKNKKNNRTKRIATGPQEIGKNAWKRRKGTRCPPLRGKKGYSDPEEGEAGNPKSAQKSYLVRRKNESSGGNLTTKNNTHPHTQPPPHPPTT